MRMQRGFSLWTGCAVVCAMLAITSSANAELLGYWSANSPNDDFEVQNDFGNADYVAIFGFIRLKSAQMVNYCELC